MMPKSRVWRNDLIEKTWQVYALGKRNLSSRKFRFTIERALGGKRAVSELVAAKQLLCPAGVDPGCIYSGRMFKKLQEEQLNY